MELVLVDCLEKFLIQMERKLQTKEISGWKGWNDRGGIPDNELIARLKNNLEKGDYVDVANLAMFLWWRNLLLKLPPD